MPVEENEDDLEHFDDKEDCKNQETADLKEEEKV
jgi:hypothetical protein